MNNIENCIEELQHMQSLLQILPGVVLEDCLNNVPACAADDDSRVDSWLCKSLRICGLLPRVRERKLRKIRKRSGGGGGGSTSGSGSGGPQNMVKSEVHGPDSGSNSNSNSNSKSNSKTYSIFDSVSSFFSSRGGNKVYEAGSSNDPDNGTVNGTVAVTALQ